MALTSTLYTGLSGLNVNQARLNVIGNNIANVNTVAFKSSRAIFKPQFYVTDAAGSPPSTDFGGTNPSQRGLGAQVASIEKDFSPGTIEPTGKPTDMAIDGDGFFVVKSNELKYTRDGSFLLNQNNDLVTTGGDFVQGYGVDANSNILLGSTQNINIPLNTDTSAKATDSASFKGNLNADGTIASSSTVLTSQAITTSDASNVTDATLLTSLVNVSDSAQIFPDGRVLNLSAQKGGRSVPEASFTVSATSTVGDLKTFFNQKLGIDTSVTPTAGADMVVDPSDPTLAQFAITGNVGTENALAIDRNGFDTAIGQSPFTFTQTAGASGESTHTVLEAYDSLGTPLTVDLTVTLESKSDAGVVWRFFATSADSANGNRTLGSGTLSFNTQGKLIDSTGSPVDLSRVGTGAAPMAINLDFSNMTSLTADQGGISSITPQTQNGYKLGTLSSFSVGLDGTITGSYTNGMTRTLGQLAVATFDNPKGLDDKGGNMYTASANSGIPTITTPQSLGAGAVRSGSLELSNVDISQEFVNMIISSTGFSAASRVITTSDQLLTDLLNTVR